MTAMNKTVLACVSLNCLKRIADKKKKKKKKAAHTYTKDLIFECQFYFLYFLFTLKEFHLFILIKAWLLF